jgi:hypothetical protein
LQGILMASTYPSPNQLTLPNGTPILVSNVAIQVTSPNLQRLGLYVFNPSSTITLWVGPAISIAVGAGVTIQPLQGVMFGPPNTPAWTNAMFAIASAAGSNVIVIDEYYT